MEKIKILFTLFRINLYVSSFAFGGGYTAIPMMKKIFVDKRKQMTELEMMNLSAVAQSSPGAIAINLSMLTGYKTAGLTGAVVSCIAAVLPPIIILMIISLFYTAFRTNSVISAVLKGMEAGAAALVVDTAINMCKVIFRQKELLLKVLVPVVFAANFILKINVVFLIAVCSALCVGEGLLKRRREFTHADH